MNKKIIAQIANGHNLQAWNADQAKGKPPKTADCSPPEAFGCQYGKKGADSADNKPVEENQGNDELVSLELGQKFTNYQ
jgi:hypothetical protein